MEFAESFRHSFSMTDSSNQQLARFGQVVKQRREQLGLRQDQLAERGGPSTTTLTKVENGSPPPPTPVTLRKLDAGLGWDAGSAAATLAGGVPSVSGTIRDRSGKPIQQFTAIEDAEQETLERLRLATIIIDTRDLLRTQGGPFNRSLTTGLNEAIELVTRLVARAEDYALADAERMINATRDANAIRRQGELYVIDNSGAEDERDTDTTATAGTPSQEAEGQKNNVRDLNRRNPASPVELPAAAFDPQEEGETERARRLQDEAAERGE